MTQLADIMDRVNAVAASVCEPFKDGIDLKDFAEVAPRIMAGIMEIAGVLDMDGPRKKALVIEAWDELVTLHRGKFDIPWVPGWIDNPIEDWILDLGKHALEVIYDAAAGKFPSILG